MGFFKFSVLLALSVLTALPAAPAFAALSEEEYQAVIARRLNRARAECQKVGVIKSENQYDGTVVCDKYRVPGGTSGRSGNDGTACNVANGLTDLEGKNCGDALQARQSLQTRGKSIEGAATVAVEGYTMSRAKNTTGTPVEALTNMKHNYQALSVGKLTTGVEKMAAAAELYQKSTAASRAAENMEARKKAVAVCETKFGDGNTTDTQFQECVQQVAKLSSKSKAEDYFDDLATGASQSKRQANAAQDAAMAAAVSGASDLFTSYQAKSAADDVAKQAAALNQLPLPGPMMPGAPPPGPVNIGGPLERQMPSALGTKAAGKAIGTGEFAGDLSLPVQKGRLGSGLEGGGAGGGGGISFTRGTGGAASGSGGIGGGGGVGGDGPQQKQRRAAAPAKNYGTLDNGSSLAGRNGSAGKEGAGDPSLADLLKNMIPGQGPAGGGGDNNFALGLQEEPQQQQEENSRGLASEGDGGPSIFDIVSAKIQEMRGRGFVQNSPRAVDKSAPTVLARQ